MLSAIVITKNEGANIKRCLTSLAFADERIVVDSGSTDRTVEFARSAGAQVYTNPWPGYGPQKNFGLEKAQGDWILFIDADEEVTPELTQEISRIVLPLNKGEHEGVSGYDYYWLKIATIFLGEPLNHLYGHNLRLFRKGTAKWTNANVHEQVTRVSRVSPLPSSKGEGQGFTFAAKSEGEKHITNSIIHLNDPDTTTVTNPLLHHSHQTISSYLDKMYRYTTLDAEEMHKTNRHRSGRPVSPSWFLPWHLSLRQFIKLYFYRRGILDGYAGLAWCVLSSYYEWEMANKYIKSQTSITKPQINPKL